ncbi:MAG TPA: MBL fold metallo-hydrolase [Bryobacteraceae bacterium]|jgi:glyoxylase-like metal-dependent hydrolase (beta-lactamase superfamily II)|nr:MBL fold metallo-hydrolase [Bryobacteraceae bacterium]
MKLLTFTILLCGSAWAQAQPQPAQPQNDVHVFPVQGNVSMLVGPGGNMTIQAGKDGIAVVDTQTAAAAPQVMAAIRKLSDTPIIWVINTSLDADHIGGNEALLRLGGSNEASLRARVVTHENVLDRLVKMGQARVADAASINDTYFRSPKDFLFNGEPVMVYHMPAAHTDGDSIVLFRKSDVISSGDLFTPDRYPVIDLADGGSVQGLLDGLNRILEMAVAGKYQEGGTFVIPGHGRLCDEADVVEFRDMVTIIRDRVQDMIKKGMTLEQVKAGKPSRDYDTQYSGSPDVFVESIYKSLVTSGKR